MASELRARTNVKYRRINSVIILIIALLTVFGLVMTVYNLVKGNFLFAIAWFIASVLAGTYVLIRVNTVFATSVISDGESLYMKNWSNDFLPYDYNNKIKILSEFIPAKTKVVEIPLDEIALVVIGTKNFLKRNVSPESEFRERIRPLEMSRDFYRKRTVSSMDILYVETSGGECCYMPIVNFDTKSMVKIVSGIARRNPDVVIKSSNRAYKRLIAETQMR